MTATICDRCGKPANSSRRYEVAPVFPYYLSRLKILPSTYGGLEEETIDLCDDCRREFKKWIEGEKDGLE